MKKLLLSIMLLCVTNYAFAGPIFQVTGVSAITTRSESMSKANFALIWLDRTISCAGNTVDVIEVRLGTDYKDYPGTGQTFTNYTTLINAARESLTVEIWDVAVLGYNSIYSTCTMLMGNTNNNLNAIKFTY